MRRKLVKELTDRVGLSPVDARRAAFLALACRAGWTKSRVARWLGVTRQRVGQKYDHLLHHATSREDVPTLTEVMVAAEKAKVVTTDYDHLIEYTVEDWTDLEFADQLLDTVK